MAIKNRPPTKKEIRLKQMREAQLKQLKILLVYPFCRFCRKQLTEKRKKEILKRIILPLCAECEPIIAKKYEEMIAKWSQFQRR